MTSSNKKIVGNKGEEARTPVEAPNTLRSIAHARIIDLVSEGEIVGLVDGLKSIYLNETPIENADGTFNFKNYTVDYRYGTQTQDYIEGFPGVENELLVGVELKASTPYTRQFTNTDVNAMRVRLSTPALFKVNTENGDTRGYNVSYAIDIATDDGPWVEVLTSAFSGKTTTKYERAHRIELPTATDNWQLRVRRITADSTDTNIQDTTVVEAVTEIVDGKLRYPNSAIFGLTFDASQFQSIPSRSYDIKGRIVRVPTNYDPDTREYTGVWDGTFKLAWTDNPAWCFLDIATHERYGLGHLLDDSHINKWSLYKIAQYCDELVPDGKGGMEPRFTCNLFLQGQADAYKVLQDMSSIFRGMSYWANGEICAVGDMPGDVAYVYTPANVVGGKFEYQSSARKTRHTVALVSWNDMSDFGRSKIEYVDDSQGINRYGIQQTDVIAIGCSSQSMAQRQGRYILATSRHETNTVNFSVGLDGVIAVPGMIIGIADPNRAGTRMGGRINTMSVDGTSVILDAMPSAGLVAGDTLTVVMPDGVSATRTIASVNDAERTVVVSPGFDAQATPEAVWVAEKADLNAQKFRVVAVAENGDMTFTITALQYEEDKYDAADLNTKIDPEIIALPPIKSTTQFAPTNVTITAHEIAGQVVAMTNLTVSWDAAVGAVRYEAQLSQDNGEWIKLPVNGLNATMQNVLPGTYRARVAAINTTGVYSPFTASNELIVADQTTVPSVVGDIQTSVGIIQGDVDANAQAIIDEANARAAEMAAVAQDILDEATLRASEDVRIAQEAVDDAAAQVAAAKAILEAADVAEAQERANEDIRIAQEAADDAAAQIAAAKATLDQSIADEAAERAAQDAINAQAIIDESTERANQDAANAQAIADEITNRANAITAEANTRASEDARVASEAAADATTKVNNAKSELQAEVAVVRSQVADIYGADEWVSTTAYPSDDLVQSAGKLYRAIQAVPAGTALTNTAYWELLGNYKSLGDAVAANLSQTTTNTNSISAHSATLTDHTARLGAAESSISTLEEAYADSDEALAGRITALESTVDYPVTGVDVTASGLSALKTRVTTAEGTITAHGQQLTAIESNIDNVESNVAGNSSAIDTLETRVTQTETGITAQSDRTTALESSIDARIDGVDTLVAGNSTAIDNLETLTTQQGLDITSVANRTTSLESTVNDPVTGVDITASGLSSLKTRVTTAEGNIASITSDVTALEGRITDAEGDISANGSAISALDVRLDSAEGSITSQASDISALKSTVNNPTTGVNATASGLSSLTTRVTTAENNISSVSGDVAALQNTVNDPVTGVDITASGLSALTTRVTTAEGTISSHSSDISSLEGRITGAEGDIGAQATAISGLDTRLDSAEGTITSQGSDITALKNTVNNPTTGVNATASGLSALTTRVSTAEGTISSHTSDITSLEGRVTDTEGDITAQGSAISGLDTRLDSAEGTISSHSGSITSLNSSVSTAQATADGKGKVIYSSTAPAIGDRLSQNLWIDTASGTNKPKRWNGTAWVIVSDKAATDALAASSSNASAISSLTTRVTTAEGIITSQGNDITALENTVNDPSTGVDATASGLSALTTRVTTAEGTISSHASDITALESTVNNPTTGVNATASGLSDLTTRVTATEEGLTSQSERTDALDTAVRAVMAAGDNWIPNPTFKPTGYNMGSSYDSLASTDPSVPAGAPAPYVARLDGFRDYWPQNLAYTPVNEGDVFDCTVWVAFGGGTIGGSTGDGSFNVYVYGATGPNGESKTALKLTGSGSSVSAATPGWVKFTGRLTIPAGRPYILPFLQVNHYTNLGSTVVWYATNWQFRRITEVAANASAIDSLETLTTQQGSDITAVTNRTTALESTVNDPVTGVDVTASGLSSLKTRVTTAEGTISTHTSDITNLETRVTDTEGDISGHTTAISGLDTRLDTAEGNITNQASDITALETTVNHPSTGVAATASGLSALTTRVSTAEGTISSHTSDITALENTVNNPTTGVTATASGLSALTTRVTDTEGDISTISSDVTALEGRMTTAEGNITTQGSAIGSLDTRLDTAEGTITSQGSAITTLQNTVNNATTGVNATASGLSALTTRVTTNEGDIDAITSDVTALENTVNNATTGVNATASGLASLTTRVTTAEGTISNHTADITDLESTVNNATTGVAATASGLSALTTRVTTAEGTISTHSSDITALENRVTDTEGDITGQATAISGLDTRLDTAEGTISSHTSDITALESTVNNPTTGVAATASGLSELDTRVDSAEGTISSHTSAINALESTVNNATTGVNATASGLSALTTRVTDTEGDIAANVSSINGINTRLNNATTGLDAKASITTTNAITARLDNTGVGTIEQMATAVNVTYSEVFNATTGLGTKASITDLQTVENDLDTLTGDVSSQATQINEVSASLDNMQIGGRNLVRFNSGSQPHAYFPNTSFDSGYGVSQAASGFYQDWWLSNPLKPNTPYSVSFTAWSDGGGTMHVDLFPDTLPETVVTLVAGTPKRFVWENITSPSADMATACIRFFGASGSNGTVYLGDVKLEQGTKTSAWSANPADVDGALATKAEASVLAATNATVAQHGQDITATANTLNSVVASVGGGGNKLHNSEFTTLDHWTVGTNSTGLPTSVGVSTGAGGSGDSNTYTPPGMMALRAFVDGTPVAGTYIDIYSDPVPVEDIQRYVAAVRYNSFRCSVGGFIQYINAAGSWVDTDSLTGTGAATSLANPKLSDLPQMVTNINHDVATGATTARLVLRMASTGESFPYVWFLQPQFEQVSPAQTVPSPYAPGSAGKIAASVVEAIDLRVSTQETQGSGINKLPNTTFTADLTGWTTEGSIAGTVVRNLHGPDYQPHRTNAAVLTFAAGSNVTDYFALVSTRVEAEPNKVYAVSAYVGAHRASGGVSVRFRDSSGGLISEVIDEGAVSSPWQTLASYTRRGGVYLSPANTAAIDVLVFGRPNGDVSYSDAYVWIVKPMVAEVKAGQTQLPIWNAGGMETSASYSLSLNANGKFAGVVYNNDGTVSNAVLSFDNFTFESDDGSTSLDGGIFVQRAGGYMYVTGPGIGAANDILEWFGPNMDVGLISKTNAITYKDITGEDYRPVPPAVEPTVFNASSSSTAAPQTLQLVNNDTAGGNKAVTATYYFKGTVINATESPYSAGSATLSLWRSVGGGAYVQLGATQNVTITDTVEPGPSSKWRHTMEGSVTLNVSDTDTSLSSHTYEWRLTARSSSVAVTNQTMTLKTVEG